MDKIKLSEIFYSIQGEGKYSGVPSVFIRTFGCNFKCAGFGMPKGELSEERLFVDPKKYHAYKELPLVCTGCDSYASWDPRFKDFSPTVTVEQIVKYIKKILPFSAWRDEHLVITGGEPLLGWQRFYPSLLEDPFFFNLKELTFETNGTQWIIPEFSDWLSYEFTRRRQFNSLTFSVSPKLSCSGEKQDDAIKPEIIAQYARHGDVYLKFVIATEQDAEEALDMVQLYRNAMFSGNVYFMPIGGTENTYHLNNTKVAELAMKHGVRYSDRLQIPLFKNAWGT